MRSVGILLFIGVANLAHAAPVQVRDIRVWPAPDHSRVVFDVSGPVQHTVFVLENPDRLVLDLRGAGTGARSEDIAPGDKWLSGMRMAARNSTDLRIVFDLKRPVQPKSFLLEPNQRYGHRLVIELRARETAGAENRRDKSARHGRRDSLRDVIVAIDPGHGGEDAGAIGSHGAMEKDVVLAVSRYLKTFVDRERGMRAVLVRDGDYYIRLRRRMQIAREHRADLFVSVHADAFHDPRVHGSSVYILSRNGASSEAAKWIAARENSADLVGGVSLDDKGDLLATVLLDLSQTATLSASADVGARVLKQLATLGKTHKKRIQQAGFVVLKSPDIPSVLVETSFISNPAEERRLSDSRHQRRVARSIFKGIRAYFQTSAPPDTLLAARRHVIEEGDTLTKIARRYRVSKEYLRQVNEMADDRLKVGSVLRIRGAREI